MQAISYGNVYVARIAMGANPQQTLLTMREAEQHKSPSLILAYSPCIAHGDDLLDGLGQQDLAVASGYWPLIRYKVLARTNPDEAEHLMDVAQELINVRWETYEHMAQQGPAEFQPVA